MMITGGCECGAVQYEVDGDVKRPTGYHQFAGSKAPWFEITDGLNQHEDWPPGEG